MGKPSSEARTWAERIDEEADGCISQFRPEPRGDLISPGPEGGTRLVLAVFRLISSQAVLSFGLGLREQILLGRGSL